MDWFVHYYISPQAKDNTWFVSFPDYEALFNLYINLQKLHVLSQPEAQTENSLSWLFAYPVYYYYDMKVILMGE